MLFQFGTVYSQLQMIQKDVLMAESEVLAAKNMHTRSVLSGIQISHKNVEQLGTLVSVECMREKLNNFTETRLTFNS